VRRRERNWIRKFFPPEPVYVNPQAPPLPVPRPGACVWLGGAGLDLPGFINLDVAPSAGVDIKDCRTCLQPFTEGGLETKDETVARRQLLGGTWESQRRLKRATGPGDQSGSQQWFCDLMLY